MAALQNAPSLHRIANDDTGGNVFVMHTNESLPSWVSPEVAMMAAGNASIRRMIRQIDARNRMKMLMPEARETCRTDSIVAYVPPVPATADPLDWAA